MDASVDPTLRYLGSHARLMVKITQLYMLSQTGHLMEPEAKWENARALINPIHAEIIEHHDEEERELFVALRARNSSEEDHQLVVSLTDRLTQEHREIESVWESIRHTLNDLLDKGSGLPGIKECSQLAMRYHRHATLEETVALPLARRLLLSGDSIGPTELNHRIDKLPKIF